jgi:Holliday junction DNA helicase RuvB
MINLFGVRKFVNEFMEEWPIAFMDDYRAKEWLSEKEASKNGVEKKGLKCNTTGPAVEKSQILELAPPMSYPATATELFNEIYGMDDIKELFKRAVYSEKPIHLLLVGPPACAKSSFLQDLCKLEGSYFTVGSNSTKSGMVDALFELKPKFLIIDELEKMSIKDQTVLLSLMEGGMISETKHKKTRQTRLDTTVFAAANSSDNLLNPLLTRFLVIHLKPYSFEEFREISIRVLNEKEEIDSYTATIIADAVWNNTKSANVRDCLRIGRLARSSEEVTKIVNIFMKYNGTF